MTELVPKRRRELPDLPVKKKKSELETYIYLKLFSTDEKRVTFHVGCTSEHKIKSAPEVTEQAKSLTSSPTKNILDSIIWFLTSALALSFRCSRPNHRTTAVKVVSMTSVPGQGTLLTTQPSDKRSRLESSTPPPGSSDTPTRRSNRQQAAAASTTVKAVIQQQQMELLAKSRETRGGLRMVRDEKGTAPSPTPPLPPPAPATESTANTRRKTRSAKAAGNS